MSLILRGTLQNSFPIPGTLFGSTLFPSNKGVVCSSCGELWMRLTVPGVTDWAAMTHPCPKCAHPYPDLLRGIEIDFTDLSLIPQPIRRHIILETQHLYARGFTAHQSTANYE